MSDDNKYASYDLDDLRALSRRMEGIADDETLWQIEVEMARRESDEAAAIRERKRVSRYRWQRWNWKHFKNWVFDNPHAPRDYRWLFSYDDEMRFAMRDSDAILMWWENRRQFWNRFVPTLYGCALISFLAMLFGSALIQRSSSRWDKLLADTFALLAALPATLWACALVFIMFVASANLIYFVFAFFDVVTSGVFRAFDWRWSVLCFSLLLWLAVAFAALPCLVALYRAVIN